MLRRRRPGERANVHPMNSLAGYPLAADKRLRARAAFFKQTLGEACRDRTEEFQYVGSFESFTARERCDCRAGEPTLHEVGLMLRLADVRAGRTDNPSWPDMLVPEIRRVATAALIEKISQAKRVRQRAAVQEYAEKYRQRSTPADLETVIDVPY